MLQRILMPTDGSPESEKPLSMASQLARAQGASVTLLRIVEDPYYSWLGAGGDPEVPLDASQELLDRLEEDARASLDRLRARLEADQVSASAVVLQGPASATLLDYIDQQRPDLVVMATHGRTGLERFALGSVTDRVVREGNAPVLVMRMATEPSASLERALVMLDGSGLAEEVLPLVEMLAGRPFKHITLFRAVANSADKGPAVTYLEGVAARLAATGVPVEPLVEIGDPRPNVERAALDADLVVLCTRGIGGFDRLRQGSVAEHVMREAARPALLVRAETAPNASG